MCGSCGCSCKPGRPEKGCDCGCKMCREARASVSKSLVELGWVAKKDHPVLAYGGAGLGGYVAGNQAMRLTPTNRRFERVAGQKAYRAAIRNQMSFNSAVDRSPMGQMVAVRDAVRAVPGYKNVVRGRLAAGTAGAGLAAGGVYAYRNRNKQGVEKSLPSSLAATGRGILRVGAGDPAITGQPSMNAAKDYVASRVARQQAGQVAGKLIARGYAPEHEVVRSAVGTGGRAKASASQAFFREGGGRGRLKSPRQVQERGWNGYRNPLKKV